MKKLLLPLSLVLSLLAACVSTSSEPEIIATRLVQAPTQSPLVAQFDLTQGAALFAESCAPCHGEGGAGDGPVATSFDCPMPKLAQAGPEVDLLNWQNIVTNGQRGGDNCLMPNWNQRLNGAQIWQVTAYAFHLRYDPALRPTGGDLLASFANGTDTSYLATVDWQISRTDEQILTALANNQLAGYDISRALSGEEQQAGLVYIRSLALSETSNTSESSDTTEVAQAPGPAATEELEAPVSTEAAPAEATPANPTLVPLTGTFDIAGQAISGTAGASLPSEQVLVLRVVGLDAAGAPQEIYAAESTLGPDGRFRFEDVPRAERAITAIQTEYAGITQTADLIASDSEGEVALNFTLYETTTDPAQVVFDYVEYSIDASSEEGGSVIFQVYEVLNTGDKIYLGQEGRTLRITLPTGAVNGQIQALNNREGRFQAVEEGGQIVFYDTDPLFPQILDRIGTRYDMTYNGSLELEQTFAYPVQRMGVYVAQRVPLEFVGEGFVSIAPAEQNGLRYLGFGLESSWAAGTPLSFRVFDGQGVINTQNETAGEDDSEDSNLLQANTPLILGFGVLLLVAGGMLMVYDLQRRRLETQATSRAGNSRGGVALPNDREGLLAAIASLDADFEAGRVAEGDYKIQREVLKARLRQFMD